MAKKTSGAPTPEEVSAPKEEKSPAEKPTLSSEEKASMSAKELGDDYFERHPNSLLTSLHIASDGEIYPGTPRGKNACENYIKEKNAAGVPLTMAEYTR